MYHIVVAAVATSHMISSAFEFTANLYSALLIYLYFACISSMKFAVGTNTAKTVDLKGTAMIRVYSIRE